MLQSQKVLSLKWRSCTLYLLFIVTRKALWKKPVVELVQNSASEEVRKSQQIWVVSFLTQKLTRFKFRFEIWHVSKKPNWSLRSFSFSDSMSEVFRLLCFLNWVFWHYHKNRKRKNSALTLSICQNEILCPQNFDQNPNCCRKLGSEFELLWNLLVNIWDEICLRPIMMHIAKYFQESDFNRYSGSRR